MTTLRWKGSSLDSLAKAYNRSGIYELTPKHDVSKVWQGKTSWVPALGWIPLYLVIEQSQRNASGLYFVNGNYRLSARTDACQNGNMISSDFNSCLLKLGIDKLGFLESLAGLKLSPHEKKSLEKLLEILRIQKIDPEKSRYKEIEDLTEKIKKLDLSEAEIQKTVKKIKDE